MKEWDELQKYYEENWAENSAYLVMPASIRTKIYLNKIVDDIPIKAILDNNKKLSGTCYEDIQVFYAPDYLKNKERQKILISNHYLEISKQLNELGYCENVDYMDMHKFVSLWYWKNKRQVHVLDVHTAITTFCSLNCKNCNMFINHYDNEKRKHITLEEFKENCKHLFDVVDYCYRFTVLGGEPLLNNAISQMLQWLRRTYGEQIGIIDIVTNATVLPSNELAEVCRKYNVGFVISDYGTGVKTRQKIDELEKKLCASNIQYKVMKERNWKNFYFPKEKQKVQFASCKEHMLTCNPIFRGLNDNKFYYCHIVWSAVQAGLFPAVDTDYIELDRAFGEKDKRMFIAYNLGIMRGKYVSLCKYCGGCGDDNMEIIPAGIQEP